MSTSKVWRHIIKSIVRYCGGKSRKSVLEKIKKYLPEKYKEYREPFCGGAGLFFDLPPKGKRWINDMHPGLIAVYKALKYNSDIFIRKCRDIAPERPGEPLTAARKGKKLYNARLKAVFDKFKDNTEMDQALRYYYINRTVWGGRVNYKIPSRLYFSNPKGWNIVETDILEKAAKHLKNVNITRLCATALLNTDGKDVFCYLDPPYFSDTELPASSQLYEYSFKKKDHIRLAEEVKKCKHKVLLSYDDCDLQLLQEKDD